MTLATALISGLLMTIVLAAAAIATVARQLLGWLHGWQGDDPTDPAPVDPVLDETDKRDRIDLDGDRWQWRGNTEVWQLGDHTARGNLAVLDRYYGPLRFADEETYDASTSSTPTSRPHSENRCQS